MSDKLTVLGSSIKIDKNEFICLTDIAKFKSNEPDQVIRNWLRNASTLDYLYEWEMLHNEDFKPVEFDRFRKKAGTPAFTLSVKEWTNSTDAKGITAKAGRYGGTYAHSYIAFEFCTAISARFKLNLIRQYQKLKGLDTAQRVRRELSKANYLLLTNAVREKIPSQLIGTKKAGAYYASEADLINMVLFGQTSKQWRKANPNKKGNIRDHAKALDLLILSNLEAINTYLIKWDTDQEQRIEILTDIAKHQKELLPESKAAQRIIKKIDKA